MNANDNQLWRTNDEQRAIRATNRARAQTIADELELYLVHRERVAGLLKLRIIIEPTRQSHRDALASYLAY